MQSMLDLKLESGEFHQLKQDMREQMEKVNEVVSLGWSEHQIKIESLVTGAIRASAESMDRFEAHTRKQEDLRAELLRLRDSHQFLMEERAEDLNQIGDLLKESARQTINEVMNQVDNKCLEIDNHIMGVQGFLTTVLQTELADKVRVEEVQDALKRLAEGFEIKIDGIE